MGLFKKLKQNFMDPDYDDELDYEDSAYYDEKLDFDSLLDEDEIEDEQNFDFDALDIDENLNDILLEDEEKEKEKEKKKAERMAARAAEKAAKRRQAKVEEEKYDKLLNSVSKEDLTKRVDNIKPKKQEFSIDPDKYDKTVVELEDEDDSDIPEVEDDYNENAVDIPDVLRKPKKLEPVNTKKYGNADLEAYVRSQCEVMEEASMHIETAMEEYNDVTEHFSDIQLIENAPVALKSQIVEAALNVDNLTVDRRIFKSSESRLSNNTYRRMERFEDEIPVGLKYIKKQETYYETVKRDMRMLEGERMSQRIEARSLAKRQLHIKNAALTGAVMLGIVFILAIIGIAVRGTDEFISIFIGVVLIGAVLALGMFAILKKTEREVMVTEIKLNKATNLLNKTKIKYINSANALDYEYNKYHIRSSYELGKKYEIYMEMKNEQSKMLSMTANLNHAEEDLMKLLRQLGLYDATIWIGQVKALADNKEMVEVRHELALQRQKLRSQIEYNEGRIDEAKLNIKNTAASNPSFAKDALKIVEQYEEKNR